MDHDQTANFSQPLPEAIRAGLVAALFRRAVPGFAITLAVAAVCAGVLWGDADRAALAGWFVAAVAVAALRYVLVRRYGAAQPGPAEARAWEHRFAVGAAAMGVVWGALAALIDPANHTLQLVAALIIGGVTIGAMGVLAPSRLAFFSLATPMLGAQAAAFLWSTGELSPALGLLGLVFLAAVGYVFDNLHRAVAQNIERGIVNERLLAEQRGLFDAATVGIVFLRDHKVVQCNVQFARMLGWSHGELIGASSRLCFTADGAWERLVAQAEASTRPGHVERSDLELEHKGGERIWCDTSLQAVIPGRPELGIVAVCADITERRRTEAALRESEERLRESETHFRHLVETANDLVWAVDREGRWTYLSPRATRQIFGCEPEDMLRERLVDSQPERERERTRAMLARVLADGMASHFETVHLDRQGREVVLSLNATPRRASGGATVGVTGTATNITELKRKEAELSGALAEQQLLFDSVSEGIVLLRHNTVRKCNTKFAGMLGYQPEELLGQPSLVWYAEPAEWEHVGRAAQLTMAQGRDYAAELLVKRKDGSRFWCDIHGRAIDPGRSDDGAIFVFIDISARKEREQRIQHLADHDALTGLLNRRLLDDRLRQAINLARRNESTVAVMLIDLDGFKSVNDRFGHLTGDYVLRTVAKRFKDCVRESDTVARLGGDEFVLLLTGQRAAEASSVVAEKILGALAEPVAAGGRRFEIGASIGISCYPRDGATPEQLLKYADTAMYRVKEAGKNRYEFYSS